MGKSCYRQLIHISCQREETEREGGWEVGWGEKERIKLNIFHFKTS